MDLLNTNLMQFVADFSGYEGAQFSSDRALGATFLHCHWLYKILLRCVHGNNTESRYFFFCDF